MAEAKNEYRQPPPGGVEIFLVHVGDDIWRLPDLLALAANDSRFRAFSSEVYGTVTSMHSAHEHSHISENGRCYWHSMLCYSHSSEARIRTMDVRLENERVRERPDLG